MSIDILSSCACAYLALNNIRIKGENPQFVNGTLQQGSGVTIQIGDFVKYDTTTNDWERVLTTDSLTFGTDRVAVVARLKEVSTGEEKGSVTLTSGQFKNALLWMNGGNINIRCADCYLYDGSGVRTVFNPETHTSLAGLLQIHPFNDIDGGQTYYFAFN